MPRLGETLTPGRRASRGTLSDMVAMRSQLWFSRFG
jgi:hypothetical protein